MQYYYMAFIPTEEGYAIVSPDFTELSSQGATPAECMDMASDALSLIVEEYAKVRKDLPAPCSLEVAQQRIQALLQELESTTAATAVIYQMVAAPEADMTPVKISATFTRQMLDIIDMKAKAHGMTRSGFLAAAARAYS